MDICQLTVEAYINIIENPMQSGNAAVLAAFKTCIGSHRNLENKEKAWCAFSSLLVAFSCLCSYQEVVRLNAILDKYEQELSLNPPSDKRNPFNAYYSHKQFNSAFVMKVSEKGTTEEKEKAIKEKFDGFLEGLKKTDPIGEVLVRLRQYVETDALDGYDEIAEKGFDFTVEKWKIIAELRSLQEKWNSQNGIQLAARCRKMMNAGAKQIVFTGAPGTGKTYTAKTIAEEYVRLAYLKEGILADKKTVEAHIETVQFHASYDYSDFVEGLRPVSDGNGGMAFVRVDGSFKAFCRKIMDSNDSNKPYFFLIDEINRADLSRVFGELMYCLDESYRQEGVKTQYTNLPTYEVCRDSGQAKTIESDIFALKFRIPKNLYILATMNDIDRSVEAFDFALRRRFKWLEVSANDEMEAALTGMLRGVPKEDCAVLVQKAKALNEEIAKATNLGLNAAYQIGHAYYKTYQGTAESLQDIWDNQISMILKEYTRGKGNAEAFLKTCENAFFKVYTKAAEE